MPPLVVGVDGGGTRTRLILMERIGLETVERAHSLGPSSLVGAADPEEAATTVARLTRRLIDDWYTDRPGETAKIAAVWAGLAGAGRESRRYRVERRLREALWDLTDRVGVGTDAEAAHYDAFGTGPGILLIAGTGSGALARAEDGKLFRVGGWGTALGDEGSGYAIGVEALRAVLRAHDGRGPDTKLASLLDELHLGGPDELVDWMAAAEKSAVGALAPSVFGVASGGDAVAEAILDAAAEALLLHVRAAGNRGARGRVALVGGLTEKGGALSSRIREALKREGFARLARSVRPERGAARLAWEMVGS